jgi:N-acetylglucosaminyl-diphospho-decaprenol L-rhamnosyltransferase
VPGEAAGTLAAVVLHYNDLPVTLRCVEAVRAALGPRADVRVVDNASPDGSGAPLAAALGAGCVRSLPENTGYAGGMKAAVDWAFDDPRVRYVLALTPDVRVDAGAVDALLQAAEADPRTGALGPRVRYTAAGGARISAGGWVDPASARVGHRQALDGPDCYEVDWLDGGCMLLRREAWQDVGGLDARYFMYYEDADFGQRLRRAGWRVVMVPSAGAVHDTAEHPGPHYFYYMNRNAYLFWNANYSLGFARVAAASLATTARMVAGAVRAVLDPRLWGLAGERWRMAARQGVGSALGLHDAARGRLGRQRY